MEQLYRQEDFMTFFIDKCAICNQRITKETPFLVTSGCLFPEPHYLWKFCDTGLHQTCLAQWEHRIEFSLAFCTEPLPGNILKRGTKWILRCGPLIYGPYGKVELPYYAEIRLTEWPLRLYSRFLEWGHFIVNRQWEDTCIEPLNKEIQAYFPEFPNSTEQLQELLLPHVIELIQKGQTHRSRYVGVLALELFGQIAHSAIPVLTEALDDEHGSVRQAAHILLKKWKTETPQGT